MSQAPPQAALSRIPGGSIMSRPLARRLAAAGLGVQYSPRPGQLTITGATTGKSLLAVDPHGPARWLYEPTAGPLTSPATLTAIIAYLLGAPTTTVVPPGYHAFPLKGQVGRTLQDQGLTVTLQVSEDWESFEATTDIDITHPAHPWLGTITLSDDATLDWHCDVGAAFHNDPIALIDVITPILRGPLTSGSNVSNGAFAYP